MLQYAHFVICPYVPFVSTHVPSFAHIPCHFHTCTLLSTHTLSFPHMYPPLHTYPVISTHAPSFPHIPCHFHTCTLLCTHTLSFPPLSVPHIPCHFLPCQFHTSPVISSPVFSTQTQSHLHKRNHYPHKHNHSPHKHSHFDFRLGNIMVTGRRKEDWVDADHAEFKVCV